MRSKRGGTKCIQAVESVQAKEIKGRMVAVDFAVAASEYLKAKVNGKGILLSNFTIT